MKKEAFNRILEDFDLPVYLDDDEIDKICSSLKMINKNRLAQSMAKNIKTALEDCLAMASLELEKPGKVVAGITISDSFDVAKIILDLDREVSELCYAENEEMLKKVNGWAKKFESYAKDLRATKIT